MNNKPTTKKQSRISLIENNRSDAYQSGDFVEYN